MERVRIKVSLFTVTAIAIGLLTMFHLYGFWSVCLSVSLMIQMLGISISYEDVRGNFFSWNKR